jgi:hypothetical protein
MCEINNFKHEIEVFYKNKSEIQNQQSAIKKEAFRYAYQITYQDHSRSSKKGDYVQGHNHPDKGPSWFQAGY